MLCCRKAGQWTFSSLPANQFTEVLQRQYIDDVDHRMASLQQQFPSEQSLKLSSMYVKTQLLQWDHRLPQSEVEGVVQDLVAECAAKERVPVSNPFDELQVADLLTVVKLNVSWSRLQGVYDVAGTLEFVRNLHASDVGIHSTGELPEIA